MAMEDRCAAKREKDLRSRASVIAGSRGFAFCGKRTNELDGMFRLTIALAAAVLGHASSVTIEGFANTVMQDNFDAGEVRCTCSPWPTLGSLCTSALVMPRQ
jgi:hypothetical protein